MERGTEVKVAAGADGRETPGGRIVPSGSDDTWLRLLGQISPVAIYRTDAEGNCTYANERWCELTGLPADAAMGSGWSRAIHPDDLSAVTAEWKRTCAVGAPFRMEYRYLRPDGSVVWILGQALGERDPAGRLVGYVGTTTDTTELHLMREAMQRSHAELEQRVRERTLQFEHMALIVAASADAIVSSDLEGRIVSWNPGAESIFGYPASEMIGQTTYLLTPTSLQEEARLLKAQVRRGERLENLETIRVSQSGELIEVALSIFPLRNDAGDVIGTSAIVRDIRAQKKAERRLRELSGRLLRVQDEERRNLARDLHDSTAQSLAALSINLSMLNGASALPEEKRKAMVAAGLELAQSIERELRTHTYLLHPPLLEDHGLVAALRWFVDGFTARSGVAVELEMDEDLGRLPDRYELTIFRVVQECLSNIHRHTKSPTASIRLRKSEGVILLEVRDAGCGFPRELAEGAGVGIAGMRERLAQIGGELEIQTAPSGVTVTARIPQT